MKENTGVVRWLVQPFRWKELLLYVVLMAVVCFVQTVSQLSYWGPSRWTTVSAEFRLIILLNGPLAMLVSALVARVRRSAVCGAVPARGYGAVVSRHLVLLIAASIIGIVVGLLPLIIDAMLGATAGHIDIFAVLSGLMAVAGWCSLGYLIGALVPFPYSLPASVVASILLLVIIPGLALSISSDGHGYPAIMARWQIDFPNPGWHEIPEVSILRGIIALSVVGGVWIIMKSFDRPQEGQIDKVRVLRFSLAILIPATLVTLGLIRNPSIVAIDDPRATTCVEAGVREEDKNIRLCLDQEIDEMIPLLREGFQRVESTVGTMGFSGDIGPDFNATVGRSPEQAVMDFSSGVISAFLSDPIYEEQCPVLTPAGTMTEEAQISSVVHQVILYKIDGKDEELEIMGESDDFLGRFSRLTDDELKTWLDGHADGIRQCTITASDIPW
jgi:hypothetical protein